MATDTRVDCLVINVLSLAQYSALTDKSNSELYLVPDVIDTCVKSNSTNPVAGGAVKTYVDNNFLNKLVSGTSIKTINNCSVLGSGNISISPGDTNVIETVKVNGTALIPDNNKAVNITVPSEVTLNTVAGWGFSTAEPGTLDTTATSAQTTKSNESLSGSVTLHKISKTGTFSDLVSKPTTLSGYGITDAKILNGTITLGSNTITPLTSSNVTCGCVVQLKNNRLELVTTEGDNVTLVIPSADLSDYYGDFGFCGGFSGDCAVPTMSATNSLITSRLNNSITGCVPVRFSSGSISLINKSCTLVKGIVDTNSNGSWVASCMDLYIPTYGLVESMVSGAGSNKLLVMSISTISSDTTSKSLAINTYYRHLSTGVGNLTLTLPTSASFTKVEHVIVHLKTGSSPNVTFTSANSATISYVDGFALEANKEYEISILWNGAKWIVAYNTIATS